MSEISDAIGTILPIAVGVAISPIPIIAVILMLFTNRARSNSLAFVLGWVLGLVVSGGLLLALAGASDLATTDDGPSTAAGIVKLVLGMLLLLLGVRNWRGRSQPGGEPEMPGGMTAIDGFTAVKSIGLAILLSGINPKNLALTIAAVAAISSAALSTRDQLTVFTIYVLVASLTVALPVIYYLVQGDRAEATLMSMRDWLAENNTTVMAVLLLVLGVKLVGDGIAILGS